jgi:hypothetical protein
MFGAGGTTLERFRAKTGLRTGRAAAPGHAPNAVRLAVGAPAIEQLEVALRILPGMLNAREEDFDSTE